MINSNPTLCLNMIVKNESKIITRLFNSVLPIIDSYCICDTGSTDNTCEIITNYFKEKNIPGKIVLEPFKNFCHNRTFALHQCVGMSDYVLLLDADMILDINNFDKTALKLSDSFTVLQGNDSFYYQNMRIVKNNGLYKYVGVTHEYIDTPQNNTTCNIRKDQLFIRDIGDGGAKSDKFERDIKLLKQGLIDEPNNPRYYFYLANSYHDSGKYWEAIDNYKKRIKVGGWDQEVWFSYYRIGLCYKYLNNFDKAIFSWLEGNEVLPERLEGIYEIIKYYRETSKQKNAVLFFETAKKKLLENKNKDHYLFLHNDVYKYKIYYEYTICACYANIKNINDEIVLVLNNSKEKNLNENLLSNMKFYKDIITPIEVINFDSKMETNINDTDITLFASSSSLIQNANKDGYHFNIRYVNYVIDHNNGGYSYKNNITTINKHCSLSSDLKIIEETTFELNNDNRLYLGIEDVRIFHENNKLGFIGTGYFQNTKLGVVKGDYNIETKKLMFNELTHETHQEDCEKNWALFYYKNKAHFVYKWSPLEICEINSEKNSIKTIETKTMPNIFNYARGSTCGFTYETTSTATDDENIQLLIKETEIWFVVHLVSYERPRHYYHMLVVFDSDMNLLRYSAPFKFEGTPIEYCLGLVVEDDRVLMTYSNWDNTSRIGVYDKKYIDSIIKYN